MEELRTEDNFINQVEATILENVSNEQFGVSELSEAMNMSRSNLLRKIKKHTNLSASLFIRQVRLQKGMELLKGTSLTVSEVSYKVGFGSSSYFIKCFREYYGYPPGEVGKREPEKEPIQEKVKKQRTKWLMPVAITALLIVITFLIFHERSMSAETPLEKSIAVLPFKNESSDSSNLYFVNGLMESALTNLQRIEDLRVISRTSVEQYRYSDKTIPEIAEELDVNYIVEGSGQKVGDKVLLNIQLIDASKDKHIWAEQYNHQVEDIFVVQNEVAKKIAVAVEAVITPAELERIDKKPTEDLVAYDYFLQALDPYYSRTKEGLETAIPLFEQAIEHDPQFALAYANIAISYYFLDMYQREKQYTELINFNADKALLYDATSDESLIAKALYYTQITEYRLALPHLEKALEYNPNSSAVVQLLSNMYANYLPNTAKYLEYALKGIQIDIAASDSITRSYIYLQLSNALIQSGFVDEALKYINLSLDFNPENYYSPYLKAMIVYAKNRDMEHLKWDLLYEWKKDTNRLDIIQEIAKVYYLQEHYDSAFYYYQRFVSGREMNGLDIYPHEDIRIGYVYEQLGLQEQAKSFNDAYALFCENDESIYKGASTAALYTHQGEFDLAIEQLKIFSLQDNYMYWVLVFMRMDPLTKVLEDHPEYEMVMKKIEDHFWENQAGLKVTLEEKGLI